MYAGAHLQVVLVQVVLVQYVVAVVANQLLKQDSTVLETRQKILFVMIAEKLWAEPQMAVHNVKLILQH